MGKILQKKKARSGLSKARPKNNLRKSGNRKVNMLGNAIIAENWDKKLTLTQNYQRLGLMHKLNAPTGGRERIPGKTDTKETPNSLHISDSAKNVKLDVIETKVERDPETGKILRVIRPEDEMVEVGGRKHKASNPLNDPLNELSDDEHAFVSAASGGSRNGSAIVQQLEKQADMENQGVKAKKPRHQSKREEEWVLRLVEKYGDDYVAMARDRKLNPMQQSVGDLRRRVNKCRKV
ncbi:uncharacterized protein N7469_004858 [Penicillium citrinum]|uniref:Nucleolar protein 16 n=2 Tax=Penicillium TaxID=5073 RepID=A0A9W9TQY4_PENCI|nr:uncharacterized protein N7469_004858 [Penicillium citrinum]KAJ5235690.1 hypothetical protein N7469_004858 [Penicillium citrinum]KAJ5591254.1 hypothetical protein N7450_005226 [Penicillium hetheringtonii]